MLDTFSLAHLHSLCLLQQGVSIVVFCSFFLKKVVFVLTVDFLGLSLVLERQLGSWSVCRKAQLGFQHCLSVTPVLGVLAPSAGPMGTCSSHAHIPTL